ncbi:MAG: hypothetical protein H0W84_05935 [Bacteroidetes bacterium]|nr:hypothetical protein [Bacteroidota bacterium]
MRILLLLISLVLVSCKGKNSTKSKVIETKIEVTEAKTLLADTINTIFKLEGINDTMMNGEEILKYSKGGVKAKGFKKAGKREGVWKTWYDNGIPWSETTFKEGKKEGKTTTWYENGRKRYEGFYNKDMESGKWTFWNELGNIIETKDYGEK